MRRLRKNQSGIIYIFATIIAFMFIIGLVAWMLSLVMSSVSTSMTPLVNSYHNDTWTMSVPLTYAESFMTYFWQFILVFAMFGLAYWVWMYSQHRGQQF